MGKLIRLELFNFKSYKGHHVLLFGNSYFTSIIGPNGSGKSNSMDAISFVLGIKSSHLRSTHLRDLVYRGRILKTSKINADGTATDAQTNGGVNGDAEGQANGAAGSEPDSPRLSSQRNDPQTAWVMAVYEDDAGEEQRWKRSITAQGQSEYRINNRVVNAKQYNEALEAENILIKARNFLVFQGDVESIANQSPMDLTRLVEQISGSLEYKNEYEKLEKDAEKAMEEQNFKLTQRRAINAEIKEYSEQKKEADAYNDKLEERDQAIVTHVLWRLYHFQQTIDESTAEIQRHQNELKEFRRNVEKYERALDGAKKEQAKAGKDVQRVEKSIKAKEKEAESKRNTLIPIDEKIPITQRSIDKFAQRVSEVRKERDAQHQNVSKLEKDLGVVQKAQSQWESEWQLLASKTGRQLNEGDLQEYNRLRSEVNKRTAELQVEQGSLDRQHKTDGETVKSLKGQVETYEKNITKLDNETKELLQRQEELNSESRDISKNIETKKKRYNDLTSERLRRAQRQTELDEKLQEVLNKLLEADDGRRQSEKEIKAKETVTNMKRLFPGVRGRVSELCKPKQKKFETAVATVLGRHFESIVVDTEKTAKDCITYLKEQRVGQQTFIPLDTIQIKSLNSALKGMHKNMRLAIDTIDYDRSLERALSYVCGNAMICDDLNTAKYLCYEKHVEAKAVTLDGTVIHKAGLMTGGRGPNDRQARQWQDSEVENLRRLKDKLLADLQALPKSHKGQTDEESLQGELSSLEQQLSFTGDELKALAKNLASKKKELDFTKKQLKETQPKYKQQSQALQALQSSIDGLQTQIQQVEDQVFAVFCQRLQYENIRAYEVQQGTLQQEQAQKKLEFTQQKGRLDNQLTFERQRLQATDERIASLQKQAERDSGLIAQMHEEKSTIEDEIQELESELEQIVTDLEKVKETYSEKGEKVAEERRELQKRSKDVESTTKTITGLEAEIQRNSTRRYGLLRKCKIDEIEVPLTKASRALDALPMDSLVNADGQDAEAMDIDEAPDSSILLTSTAEDYGIEIDFDHLDDELKEDDSPSCEETLESKISNLNTELQSLTPNMRALDRLETAKSRLDSTTSSFETARSKSRAATEAFQSIRSKRAALFRKAFEHISGQIDPVYKALTRSASAPLGGQAYLDTTVPDDDEAPFSGGLKYHAMPPLKRFRDMDALSGGEKTIAALALLFAVHSYAPSPFFVLDEVDAALDNANVAKVAKYIREHAGPGMQFIVISLKTGLFQESECLVGILRDQSQNSSRAVTLDLRKYIPS